MRDFNFFEPYIGKNKSLTGVKQGKKLVLLGMMALMILYPIYNGWQLYKTQKQVITVGLIAESSEIREGKRTMGELTKNLEELQTKHQNMVTLIKNQQQQDMINDLLIYTINDQLPEEVFLQSIKMSLDKVEIQGVAKNKMSIALVENNLSRIEIFENVFIPSIIENSGYYTFTLSFTFKGGINDEAN